MNSIKTKIIIGFISVIIAFSSFMTFIIIVNNNLLNKYKDVNSNIIKEGNLRDNVWELIEISYRSFNSGDYSPYYKKLEDIKNIERELDVLFLDEGINNKTRLSYRSFKNSLKNIIDSIENSKFE